MKNEAKFLTFDQIAWCNKNIIVGSNDEWIVDDEGKIKMRKGDRIIFDRMVVSFPVKFADCKFFVCPSRIRSLEGSPDKVDENFSCKFCYALKTLDGIPKIIGRDLDLSECVSLSSIDALKNVSIKGRIFHGGCSSLSKEEAMMLSNRKIFSLWQNGDLSSKKFIEKYRSYFDSLRYDI